MDIESSRCPVTTNATGLVDAALYGQGAPHALWTDLRLRAPVMRHSLPDGRTFWSVTSYRCITEVLQDAKTFTSQRGTLLYLLGQGDPAAGIELVATDPPRHTSLRTPLQRALAAKPVTAKREVLRKVVCDALAPLADGGSYDLAEHARQLAVSVLGTLMGLPASDWARLAALSVTAVAPEDPRFGRPGEGESVLRAAHRELFAYFHDIVRRRRLQPGDDLISMLIATTWDGRPLNQAEIISNCYSLLLGGTVTMSQVPVSTLADLMQTAELEQWSADPALLSSGVEEALRWATPNTHFMRYAVRDTELGGQLIRADDAVVAWLPSANRDHDAFLDPFKFDARRHPNKHLAFGIGPHYCVGHSVARLTLKLFFAELFSRFTHLTRLGSGTRLHSHTISGWTALPITANPRTLRLPVAY